jgi:hypothetical protein
MGSDLLTCTSKLDIHLVNTLDVLSLSERLTILSRGVLNVAFLGDSVLHRLELIGEDSIVEVSIQFKTGLTGVRSFIDIELVISLVFGGGSLNINSSISILVIFNVFTERILLFRCDMGVEELLGSWMQESSST